MKTGVKPDHETAVQGTEERQRDPDEGRPRAGNDPAVVKRQKQASVAGAKEAGCSRPGPQRPAGHRQPRRRLCVLFFMHRETIERF